MFLCSEGADRTLESSTGSVAKETNENAEFGAAGVDVRGEGSAPLLGIARARVGMAGRLKRPCSGESPAWPARLLLKDMLKPEWCRYKENRLSIS